MYSYKNRILAVAVATALGVPMAANATNGMNMEGYGPIATGMGGASMAYDNGTAAMMNNPATLGLADEGQRLDVALGFLGPDVEASFGPYSWPSDADAFYMPAVGYAAKSGQLTYGVGAFAQGGMGTEYKAGAAPGTSFVFVPNGTNTAGGEHPYGGGLATTSGIAQEVGGWDEFSQVGVMRILFPMAYNVNNQLTVGGSIDYVRATMDLKMVMTGAMMSDMMTPTQQNIGTITPDPNMQAALGGLGPIYGARFDFADDNDYDGATSGDGFAVKLGATYKVNSQLTVGATYHSETSLSDLTGNATMNVASNPGTDTVTNIPGEVAVKDFQWPQTIALGIAYQATDKLMVAADVKQLAWSDVMKDFKMSFTGPAAMGSPSMDMVMYQNWDDQTVMQAGVAYQMQDNLVLRAGVNMADNPIPGSTLHYLFPAIIENHYTLGVGYGMANGGDVNFSMSIAPEVEQTNGMGMTVTHSQTNWQLMYSHNF